MFQLSGFYCKPGNLGLLEALNAAGLGGSWPGCRPWRRGWAPPGRCFALGIHVGALILRIRVGGKL